MTGLACANCIVEVFSDSDNEGETYEGQTEAYGAGLFTFSKGSAFAGPHVTTYATDPGGSTTEFSRPSQGGSRALTFQDGNPFARLRLQTKPSGEMTDNRMSAGYGKLAQLDNETAQHVLKDVTTLGTKGFETTFYEVEAPIDWSILPESVVPAVADQFIDDLGAHGIAVNYSLHFWDKAGHAAGEELSTPRFKTEEQIQDFLDYVRDTVRQLKGRVSYYTIWTEPDNCGGTPQSGGNIKCIEPADYIALAERVIPVIRFEDPQAKVVLAPVVLFFGRDWLFTVLNSDVVQRVSASLS